MSSRLAMLFCALLLGSACTAPANRTDAPVADSDLSSAADGTTTQAVAAAEGAATAEEEDPIVCERVVRTGTRVAERICMRRSRAEKLERGGQEMLGEIQRRGTQVGNKTTE